MHRSAHVCLSSVTQRTTLSPSPRPKSPSPPSVSCSCGCGPWRPRPPAPPPPRSQTDMMMVMVQQAGTSRGAGSAAEGRAACSSSGVLGGRPGGQHATSASVLLSAHELIRAPRPTTCARCGDRPCPPPPPPPTRARGAPGGVRLITPSPLLTGSRHTPTTHAPGLRASRRPAQWAATPGPGWPGRPRGRPPAAQPPTF